MTKPPVYMVQRDGKPIDRNSREYMELMGHGKIAPMKAIRKRCLYCCCGSPKGVNECASVDCPLWPLRFGVDLFRKGKTEKQLAASRKTVLGAREALSSAPEKNSLLEKQDQTKDKNEAGGKI